MEIGLALFLGVVAGLLTNYTWEVLTWLKLTRKNEYFSISGIYVSKFKSRISSGEFIEVVQLYQNKHAEIRMHIENYASKRELAM